MKEIIQNFRNYKKRLNEFVDETQMKINVLLIIDRKLKRKKEAVLSDIRAKTGVTIIKILDHKNANNLDYNIIEMKFDLDSYKSPDPKTPVNLQNALERMKSQLLSIPGVRFVQYTSRPEHFT